MCSDSEVHCVLLYFRVHFSAVTHETFLWKTSLLLFPALTRWLDLLKTNQNLEPKWKLSLNFLPTLLRTFYSRSGCGLFFFFLSQTLENSPRTGRWRRWRSVWDRCSPGPWSRGETRQKAQTNFLQRRADAEALYRSFIRPGAGGGGRGGGLESKTSGACSEAGSPRPAWHL